HTATLGPPHLASWPTAGPASPAPATWPTIPALPVTKSPTRPASPCATSFACSGDIRIFPDLRSLTLMVRGWAALGGPCLPAATSGVNPDAGATLGIVGVPVVPASTWRVAAATSGTNPSG